MPAPQDVEFPGVIDLEVDVSDVEHRVFVVRERVPLDLKAGENAFTFAGATAMLEADSVVLSWYGVAEDTLVHALRDIDGLEVHAVGDCLAPRRAIDAIWDGFRVGVAV